MSKLNHILTMHACDRSASRNIPHGVIELILDYGDSVKARDDARKYSLSKQSMGRLKRDYGRPVVNALAQYRDAYVVMCEGRIVTVAWSGRRLLH